MKTTSVKFTLKKKKDKRHVLLIKKDITEIRVSTQGKTPNYVKY